MLTSENEQQMIDSKPAHHKVSEYAGERSVEILISQSVVKEPRTSAHILERQGKGPISSYAIFRFSGVWCRMYVSLFCPHGLQRPRYVSLKYTSL